jgi:hypothetical protein
MQNTHLSKKISRVQKATDEIQQKVQVTLLETDLVVEIHTGIPRRGHPRNRLVVPCHYNSATVVLCRIIHDNFLQRDSCRSALEAFILNEPIRYKS